MNSQQAREFRERWQAVMVIEAEEQITTSIVVRWQQMNAILRLAIGMGLSLEKKDDAKIETLYRRWASLKDAAT
jgi:hypothetical protein